MPWLNVYNPRDPLAFRAAEVFATGDTRASDQNIDEPWNLVGTHSEYFSTDVLFEWIADRLPAGGGA